jgi:ABC-type multidrug transport system ATPase subunit
MGLRKEEITRKYSEIIDFAEIGDFMETPAKRYSSGMRVRLAFAVAAHLDPDILILDEVLAVGDAKFQQKCLNRIDEIRESGVTILFVSHSADQVIKLCTKGILLHEGRLIGSGTAKEATDQYLKLLNIHNDIDEKGGQGSRAGMYSAKIAEFFSRNLNAGSLVMNVPVETSYGNVPVELGWISNERLSTLRTEPSWSSTPDIVVNVVTRAMSPEVAHEMRMVHSKNGARESWIVLPDGYVDRYTDVSMKPIFTDFQTKTYISDLDTLLASLSDR